MEVEMMIEGIVGIVEGMNPKLIRMKLDAYVIDPGPAGARRDRSSATHPAALATKPSPAGGSD